MAGPDIFNTDQGSQFTSAAFTGTQTAAAARISMDSRGRWMDNVFIERLRRLLKPEDIYLNGYADGREPMLVSFLGSCSTTPAGRIRRSATARQCGAKPSAADSIRLWT